jgi:anaerobic selenocysteine-containing dehydrogenase
VVPERPRREPIADRFRLSTRRGKQFNTMQFAERDPLTGARRDALLISPDDADRLGLADGAPVLVRSEHGELRARVARADLRPGNVQVFFPEGNVLLSAARRDVPSGVPDYNAVVELLPL